MPADFNAYENKDFTDYDLKVFNYGYRRCASGFNSGFFCHEHYLIHYIYEGECLAEIDGSTYRVLPGQMFVIFPGLLSNFTVSAENPCTYRWVEIDGSNFEKFLDLTPLSASSPVFPDTPEHHFGKVLKEMTDAGRMNCRKLNGYAWFLADALITSEKKRSGIYEKYIERAAEYIRCHSEKKTTVADVAAYLQIDRSYLSRIFNLYMGVPIKKYIYTYHMDIAKSLLQYSDLSIKEVATSVGYEDPLDFTKAFHRTYGMSPSKWRAANAADNQENQAP
ncbi:MAG: AraC family transcriptional regulator [Clostridia bacterium]|nr:AraC family transcriptional regulator [Clostridia bacterium]